MRLTIRSVILSETFEFWMPNAGGYIYLEAPGLEGTLGRQICDGGGFQGNTLQSHPAHFERACRAWYRQHLQSRRADKP